MFTKNLEKISIAVVAGIFILGFGAFFVYAGWLNPSATPPDSNITAPLTAGFNVQTKIGGLILNKAGGKSGEGAKIGLLIGEGETNNPDLGRVGIGIAPNPENRIKLNVGGNIGITGVLKPKGNKGNDNQLFTRTKNGNDWQDRFSWMTLTGMPSLCSNPVGPQPCSMVGFKEYRSYCVKDPTNQTSVTVRVCYRENF